MTTPSCEWVPGVDRLASAAAWAIVCGAPLALLAAYATPQDYANAASGYLAAAWAATLVRVFQFHIGLLLLAVGAWAGWRGRRRLALAAAAGGVAAAASSLASYLPQTPPAASGASLRVMTFNVWWRNRDTAPVTAEILRTDPDLLLVQEYTPHWMAALRASLAERYPYRLEAPAEGPSGLAIFSRRPLLEARSLLGEGAPLVRAVLRFDGRPLAVYCVHLASPVNRRQVVAGRRQLADLLRRLRVEPLPAIVGGDFNFNETAPQAAALRAAGLRDAQDAAGWGRGATWRAVGWRRWLPGFRLDHIYLTDGLVARRCRVGPRLSSDHRPVVVQAAWAAEAEAAETADSRLPPRGAAQ